MSIAEMKLGILCLLMCTLGYVQDAPPHRVWLSFDEGFVDNFIGPPLGVFHADHYAKVGVRIRTVESVGLAGIGQEMRLSLIFNGFELLGGPQQPSISRPNLLVAYGGKTRDVLLRFTKPVQSVSVTLDRSPEAPDVVRLIALEPTNDPSRFRVLGVDTRLDDAVRAPANELTLESRYEPFSYVLFQCTTEQEGFDDLRFIPSQFDAPQDGNSPREEDRPKTKEPNRGGRRHLNRGVNPSNAGTFETWFMLEALIALLSILLIDITRWSPG